MIHLVCPLSWWHLWESVRKGKTLDRQRKSEEKNSMRNDSEVRGGRKRCSRWSLLEEYSCWRIHRGMGIEEGSGGRGEMLRTAHRIHYSALPW